MFAPAYLHTGKKGTRKKSKTEYHVVLICSRTRLKEKDWRSEEENAKSRVCCPRLLTHEKEKIRRPGRKERQNSGWLWSLHSRGWKRKIKEEEAKSSLCCSCLHVGEKKKKTWKNRETEFHVALVFALMRLKRERLKRESEVQCVLPRLTYTRWKKYNRRERRGRLNSVWFWSLHSRG